MSVIQTIWSTILLANEFPIWYSNVAADIITIYQPIFTTIIVAIVAAVNFSIKFSISTADWETFNDSV
jgi:hypothetical protein